MKKSYLLRAKDKPDAPKRHPAIRLLLGIAVTLPLLLLWQLAALTVDTDFLLPTPLSVFRRGLALLQSTATPAAVLYTLKRIAMGFLAGLAVGILLALPAALFRTVELLLRPYLFTVKSVPIASFVILVILWMGNADNLSVVISFLMVLPIVYTNLLEGLRSVSSEALEMAAIYDLPFRRRLIYIYVPEIKPHLLSACRVSLGLCWKAGVAAEMIGIPDSSLGKMLYLSKFNMDMTETLALTVIIVLVSLICEKLFMAFLRLGFRLWEKL